MYLFDSIASLRHTFKRLLIKVGFSKLPDFIICGAQKSGTTFLYSVLRQHRQIVEPVNKEAHFFDSENNYKKGIFQYYLNFDLSFRFRKHQVTFEATPDYLSTREAPSRIKQCLPNVKLILTLREPISRAFSAWKMHHFLFREGHKYSYLHDPRSFEQVVYDAVNGDDPWSLLNHLGKSMYGLQLQNLFNSFKREEVLILFHSDLETRTQDTISEVCRFLGLEEFSINQIDKEDKRFWDNKSIKANSEKDKLEPELINKLNNYFIEDTFILKDQLKLAIPW